MRGGPPAGAVVPPCLYLASCCKDSRTGAFDRMGGGAGHGEVPVMGLSGGRLAWPLRPTRLDHATPSAASWAVSPGKVALSMAWLWGGLPGWFAQRRRHRCRPSRLCSEARSAARPQGRPEEPAGDRSDLGGCMGPTQKGPAWLKLCCCSPEAVRCGARAPAFSRFPGASRVRKQLTLLFPNHTACPDRRQRPGTLSWIPLPPASRSAAAATSNPGHSHLGPRCLRLTCLDPSGLTSEPSFPGLTNTPQATSCFFPLVMTQGKSIAQLGLNPQTPDPDASQP